MAKSGGIASFTILIIILSRLTKSASEVPVALPGCPDKCGDITIRYPFGTIDGCYMSKQYHVNCSTLTIADTKLMKLLHISFDGYLRVRLPIGYHCYNSTHSITNISEPKIQLSRFHLSSTENLLTVVGCDARANMKTIKSGGYYTGCLSMTGCNRLSSGSCFGMGCSQVPVPPYMTRFRIHSQSNNRRKNVGNWSYNNCTYGFLVEKGHYTFHKSDIFNFKKRGFRVILEWSVGNETCEQAQKNMSSYICKQNSVCLDTMTESNRTYQGYRCQCAKGYEGNPYLPTGCTGISIGTSVSFLLTFIIYWGLKQRQIMKSREIFFKKNGGLILQKVLFESKQCSHIARIFGASDLEKATNNFHKTNIVGQGGYGTVYKGILVDKTKVAIKKAKSIDENQIEQFINEVIILSEINHPNVVKLLGCCLETQSPLLVYEFVTNNTIFHHLHEQQDYISSMTFERRLNIATQTAEALAHIHSTTQIVHRDIKSSNILLTDDYTAKVSDFGISRFIPVDETHVQTLVHGTLGYIDPEYFRSGILTEKSDVYSFGMVLVELLTGKKVFSHDRTESDLGLATYFIYSLERGHLLQVLDDKVKKDGLNEHIKYFAKLAKTCLELEGKKRPNMVETIYMAKSQEKAREKENLMNFFLLFTIPIVILSRFPKASSEVALSLSLPGCPDKCGNITIPYPFGTVEGCYLTEEYYVDCSTLRVSYTIFKLLNISLKGYMRGLLPIGYRCYNQDHSITIGREPKIKLSRFRVSSSENVLTVVGCDARANMKTFEGEGYYTGCLSMTGCDRVTRGSCFGMGCSQVPVPPYLSRFRIHAQSNTQGKNVGNWSYNNCTYGFLVEKGHYAFRKTDVDDLKKRSFPVVLEWSVDSVKCEEAKKNASSYVCQENSVCLDTVIESNRTYQGYRCQCVEGYEGNPYLPNGCQDIDECKGAQHECKYDCINTNGSYNCSCPFGQQGDGRNDRNGCSHMQALKSLGNSVYWGISMVTSASFFITFIIYWGLKQRQIMKSREVFFKKNGGLILQKVLFESKQPSHIAKIFSARDLEKATNNFHKTNIVGQGGYGTVYKGTLSDKTMVAIKKAKSIDESQIEQFINEVIILSEISHPNVVKLLGCCLETQTPLLVYEFVTNKTIFHHLHEQQDYASSMTFERRLKIATQTAEALAHIHSTTQIVHRDIKSLNILLTDDYTAKVSDFGISRFIPIDETHVQTLVHGTLGYIDPEYFRSGILTEKSDVYSFGMVLVELLTGRKVFSHDRTESDLGLAAYFISSLDTGHLLQVLDDKVKNDGLSEHIRYFATLAKNCLELEGKKRPNMVEVKEELDELRQFYVKSSIMSKKINYIDLDDILSTKFRIHVQSNTWSMGNGDFKNCTYMFLLRKVITGVIMESAASLVLTCIIYWGLKQRPIMKSRERFFEKNGGLILQKVLFESKQSTHIAKIFAARGLEKATTNFHKTNIVGKGGYRTVYKGSFQLARHLQTLVHGTLGYIDQYFRSGILTEKGDVYSFGMVLVEILTSPKVLSHDGKSDLGLTTYFSSSLERAQLLEILDDKVKKDGLNEHTMAW
ncbi:hypothetical protein LXL04_030135 [Taraxacum kok-saghyz]